MIGDGYCKRITIKPSVEISIVDMTFFEDIVIDGRGEQTPSFYDLSFCLEGSFRWKTKGRKLELETQGGKSFLLCGEDVYGLSKIHEGQSFSYVNIRMQESFIKKLLSGAGAGDAAAAKFCSFEFLKQGEIGFSMKKILNEIINCRLSQNMKKIYLEAKIMELFAVYMEETIFENSAEPSSTDFSKEDLAGLRKAKEILDSDIVNVPSLSRLARMTHLNEYKLKRGFKALFGQPVHSYVIDKRLEGAYGLLESGTRSVSETAQLVGYNDLGRFAEKFRKKFGVNPSEYKKYNQV